MTRAPSVAKALAIAVALVPLAASATIVMQLSFEEMTHRAPTVVRGTVVSSRPIATEAGSIVTVTTLQVTERIKGSTASTRLVVRQPGGVVGGRGQQVAGAARFAEGDDVVLFLEPAIDEKSAWVVMGLSAGKVSVEIVNGHKQAVRHLDGISFAETGTHRIQEVENVEKLGDIEAFLKRLRIAVNAAPSGASSTATVRGVK